MLLAVVSCNKEKGTPTDTEIQVTETTKVINQLFDDYKEGTINSTDFFQQAIEFVPDAETDYSEEAIEHLTTLQVQAEAMNKSNISCVKEAIVSVIEEGVDDLNLILNGGSIRTTIEPVLCYVSLKHIDLRKPQEEYSQSELHGYGFTKGLSVLLMGQDGFETNITSQLTKLTEFSYRISLQEIQEKLTMSEYIILKHGAITLIEILIVSPNQEIAIFNKDSINGLFYKLPTLRQEEVINPAILINEKIESETNQSCIVKTLSWAPGFSEALVIDPTSGLYPGGIYSIQSFANGSIQPVLIGKRNIVTLSASLPFNPTPVIMETPSISSFRVAQGEIYQNGLISATPARIAHNYTTIHSEEHLSSVIGGYIDSKILDITASYDFNASNKKTWAFLQYTNVYATISMDTPASPADFFTEVPPNLANLDYCPVFVSDVTLGSNIMMVISSSEENQKVENAFNAAIKLFGLKGGVDLTSDERNTINKSNIKIFVVGCSGDLAVQTINGIEGLTNYITEGHQISLDCPGAPLSYTLRYLKDNSIAQIVKSSEYQVRECIEVDNSPKEIEVNVDDVGKHFFKKTNGDCETGKNVYNNGSIRLDVTNQGTKLRAILLFETWEPDDDHSHGQVKIEKTLYTAPAGKKINRIFGQNSWKIETYQDKSKFVPEEPEFTPNSCPYWVRINARMNTDICGEGGYVEIYGNNRKIKIEVQ